MIEEAVAQATIADPNLIRGTLLDVYTPTV